MISIQQHEDPSKYVESDLPQDQQKYKGWYWDHKTKKYYRWDNQPIEYNDFGFTAMDADELASVDTKIVEKTTSAVEVIEQMDDFIRPLLENLMKDSDKDYIYWPNRAEMIQKQIDKLNNIQKSI